MKKVIWLAVVFILAASLATQAESPEGQFVRIYNLIREGDTLGASGQSRLAFEKYSEAQTEMRRLQAANPKWNEKAVKFRLNYVAEKLAGLNAQAPQLASPLPPPTLPPPELGEQKQQILILDQQVRQLSADKRLLEAKLREALSAQPAAVDPRELSKAEENIKTLQKENELLKVNLEREQTKAGVANLAVVDQKQKALTEAIASIKQHAEANAFLTAEKESLQKQLRELKEMTPALRSENDILKKQLASLKKESNPTISRIRTEDLEAAQKAQAEAVRKLQQQDKRIEQLTLDKKALEARLRKSGLDDELKALRSETAKLRSQLADVKSRNELPAKTTQTQPRRDPKLAKQLQVENARLKQQLAELKRQAAKPVPTDQVKIDRLETERDELRMKLKAASTDRRAARGRTLPNPQVAALNAKLSALEAQRVPYSDEELALFKAPEPIRVVASQSSPTPGSAFTAEITAQTAPSRAQPVQNRAAAAKPAPRELPPGAAQLIGDAQRAFAARRYDEAERKYQDVLRLDEKNVVTLANLAAIQIEQNRYPEAEFHLKRSLAEAPDDPYSLSLFGILKFHQKKTDEAFDSLSRAAKLDPQSAETQNFLGITLSQKGLRVPAETALRKAIQLAPGYPSAHYNLAVIYATQKPPFIELARLHYQKSVTGGHPKNAELEKLLAVK